MSKNTTDFGPQTAFILEKGKEEGDTITVTRADYLAHSAECGLTKEVLNSVAEHRSAVLGGMIHAATEKLGERVKAAREAGDDPKGLSQQVRVNTEFGQLKAVVKAHRTFTDPLAAQNGGPSTITRYGSVEASMRFKSMIPKGPVAYAAEHIKSVLGVKD